MLKRSFIILVITTTFSLLLSTFMNHTFDLLAWTNTLFLSSLFLLILGGTLFVIQGDFFNGIIRSFKHFFQTMSKVEKEIREAERKENKWDNGIPYKREFRFTFSLLATGLVLFVFTLVLSFTL